jgi:glucokinase
MDIGGTHVSAADVDITARAILPGQSIRRPLDSEPTAAEFVKTLADCAAQLPFSTERRWAIALPGPFDYERGIARYEGVGKFDALRGYDLRAALAPVLPGGIAFCNDADAFGVGEWWAGAARGYRSVAGITLGTGVGSCFLKDGHPLRDGPGIPPEGRINELAFEGRPLEDTVSRQAMRQAYGADIDVQEIARRARQGDRVAAGVFERAYRVLGMVLAPVLAAFDPDILVVGGSIAASWDLIAGPLGAGLGRVGFPVRPAMHPADAPMLGAAYMATRLPVGWLLLGDLGTDLVHVQVLDRLDHLLKRGRGQRARLGEDQDPVPEGHQGRNRSDAPGGGQFGLVLGVYLAERDVRVLVASRVENRREHPARPAPRSPPVHERDPGLGHRVLERLRGQCDCTHVSPSIRGIPHRGITPAEMRHSLADLPGSRPHELPGMARQAARHVSTGHRSFVALATADWSARQFF